MGQMEAPSSWKIVKLVFFFFSKTRCGIKERNNELQGFCADVWKKEKNPKTGSSYIWEASLTSVASTFR